MAVILHTKEDSSRHDDTDTDATAVCRNATEGTHQIFPWHCKFSSGKLPGLQLLEQACRKCVAVASSFVERPVAYCYP